MTESNLSSSIYDEEGEADSLEESKHFQSRKDSNEFTSSGQRSVLDKLQDYVESELYGKSRALVRQQADSMIDTSSVDRA